MKKSKAHLCVLCCVSTSCILHLPSENRVILKKLFGPHSNAPLHQWVLSEVASCRLGFRHFILLFLMESGKMCLASDHNHAFATTYFFGASKMPR